MDGVLVVDKPEGPTSHDVVSRARRALGIRTIGHTGTLDPLATGVLVLVVGRATRLAQFLGGHRKSYDATLRLGTVTDTWDRTGTPLSNGSGPVPASPDVEGALGRFLGRQAQSPPPYSAKKVEGTRAYALARRGLSPDVRPAVVELHEARVTAVEPPIVRLALVTSAGYYVRSLVHELGAVLGCGACLEALRRTRSGEFGLDHAVDLDDLADDPAGLASRLVPLEQLLPELPAVVLDAATAERASHGNEIRVAEDVAAGTPLAGAVAVRLMTEDGRLLAIARQTGRSGVLHPAVVLK